MTIPRLLTVAASVVVVAALVISAVERSLALAELSVAAAFAAAVGWVIAWRDARTPVAPAAAWSVAAIVAVQLHGRLGSIPWSTGTWPLNLAGVFALLLVFPDGPRPGRLWSTLPWTFALATLGLQVALWGSTQETGRVTGWEPAGWRLAVGNVAMILLGATMILAVSSLVVRYRRGGARTRQQIRWLMLAGLVVVILLIGGWVAEANGATIAVAYTPFLAAIATLVPTAVGIAIVRYDLFDVDRLLSGTVAWVLTVTVSAGIFALVVFLVGQAVALGGGPRSSIAAFAAALLFLPLQRFIAIWVGRVVDRDRFVAQATVERFAADVRSGRRQPEEIESVLQGVQGDPDLVLYVRTALGGWSRLDGCDVSQPDGFALEAGGEVVAVIHLGWDSRRARRRVADVAKAAWVPIEVSRLQLGMREALEQAQESRRRLAVATADERRRLERDLHDRAQQRIVASAMSLKLLQERLPSEEAAELEVTVRELKETVDELRKIAHGVRPRQLDDGLEPALAAVRETCPIPVELDVDALPSVSDAQKLTAYLVVNEAVVNVLKHAHASHIKIKVTAKGARLAVEVTDDGIGGLPSDAPLLALRDRILSVGGSLNVNSPPGVGTTIAAVL